MSKSKKGKKASYNLAIKQCEKIINEKFIKCPYADREKLFLNLERWANDELGETQKEIFLHALYNAKETQESKIVLALRKALENIIK